MPRGFLNRFGVKEPIILEEKKLQKAIDEYYNEFNLVKKLQ